MAIKYLNLNLIKYELCQLRMAGKVKKFSLLFQEKNYRLCDRPAKMGKSRRDEKKK
jgi:hypothetical protein